MKELFTESGRGGAESPPPLPASLRVGPLLVVSGLMLLVAGTLDIALLYYPPRLGEPDWEFGVIAQSLDALPLPVMGLTLTTVGVLLAAWRRAAFVVATLWLMAALWLLASALVFALDVPQALAAAQRDVRLGPAIKRVLLKGGVFGISYGAGFISATILTWRRARRLAPGHGPT